MHGMQDRTYIFEGGATPDLEAIPAWVVMLKSSNSKPPFPGAAAAIITAMVGDRRMQHNCPHAFSFTDPARRTEREFNTTVTYEALKLPGAVCIGDSVACI